jgi:hypothetical protein
MKNILKDKFIEKVVFTKPDKTNKSIATELNISESYFYKLLKKHRVEIDSALLDKKNHLRLKAIHVIDHHLNELNLKAAIQVLRQIGWSEPGMESGLIDVEEFELAIIQNMKDVAKVIIKADTGQLG